MKRNQLYLLDRHSIKQIYGTKQGVKQEANITYIIRIDGRQKCIYHMVCVLASLEKILGKLERVSKFDVVASQLLVRYKGIRLRDT